MSRMRRRLLPIPCGSPASQDCRCIRAAVPQIDADVIQLLCFAGVQLEVVKRIAASGRREELSDKKICKRRGG